MNKFWKTLSSIRCRLAFWFTCALAHALLIFSAAVYFAMSEAVTNQLEATLHDGTLALAENLRHEFEEGDPVPLATEELIRGSSFRNLVIEIYAPDGRLLTSSLGINEPMLILGLKLDELPVLGDGFARNIINSSKIDYSGLKVAAVRVIHPATGEPYSLVVGARRSVITEELETLKRQFFTVAPLLLLLAFGGGLILARRALKPVAEMTSQARLMNVNLMSERLSITNPYDELGQLGVTFNELFDRIETAFAQMRQFIADASHELRTPVTVIRSETEVALTDPRDPDEAFCSLEIIRDESQLLSRLVEDMFTLARADADHYNILLREQISLVEIIETCARSAATLGRSRGVSVKLDNQIPESTVLIGDRIRISQLLLNVLDNATKYVPSGGKVNITAELSGTGSSRQAMISIEDNGPGISDNLKEAVFNRFYRVDRVRTRISGGSGLGLPIARSIAEAHGGQISLSDSKSGGCLFIISLPTVQT